MADIEFAFDSLTLDEVDLMEELTGFSIDALQAPGSPKGKVMKAIVFIVKRRADPEFTFEDAGRLSIKEVDGLIAASSPPTTAAA